MKRFFITSLFFLSSSAQLASKIYTGFNHGAFWAVEANVKKKVEFLDSFNLAKNLTADILFDSARLFTCKAAGSFDEPTEAFDAAVESNTNLLLGFWITPSKDTDSPNENVKNEMTALKKGFKKHGQALSDLVIGLAVGSEDIYRAEEGGGPGVTTGVVEQTIAQVKKSIAESPFAEYMKDKPIGHIDTAKYAVVDNADFIGMTAYPYWNEDSIEAANMNFHASLEDVKKRADGRPVWIAEMGWPMTDTEQHGAAVAGFGELQRFWNEVGCSVFGKYTTFWYELMQDSTLDQKADWGLIDIPSRKPRIKNLSCVMSNQSSPALPSSSSRSISQPVVPSSSGLAGFKPPSRSNVTSMNLSFLVRPSSEMPQSFFKVGLSTTHMTVTRETTVLSPHTAPFTPSIWNKISFVTVIVTKTSTRVVDVQRPLTTMGLNADHPLSAPVFTSSLGMPFLIFEAHSMTNITPVPSLSATTAKPTSPTASDNTAYCDSPITTTTPTQTVISTLANWCFTVADIDRNGHPVIIAGGPAASNGKCSSPPTFSGRPYASTHGPAESVTPSSVPTGRSWCIAMAGVDGNSQMVPVDARPAGLDGECGDFSIYGDAFVTTLATLHSLISTSSEQTFYANEFGDWIFFVSAGAVFFSCIVGHILLLH